MHAVSPILHCCHAQSTKWQKSKADSHYPSIVPMLCVNCMLVISFAILFFIWPKLFTVQINWEMTWSNRIYIRPNVYTNCVYYPKLVLYLRQPCMLSTKSTVPWWEMANLGVAILGVAPILHTNDVVFLTEFQALQIVWTKSFFIYHVRQQRQKSDT